MLSRFPYEMSGGERQRIGFAQALAVQPKLILADEPVSMLDVSIRVGVLNMMAGLRDREGVSLLYITHDLASARYVADRIVVMYAGHLVEEGPTETVLSSPKHPYTQLLLVGGGRSEREGRGDRRRQRRAAASHRSERGLSLPLALSVRDREVLAGHTPAEADRNDPGRMPRRGRRRRDAPPIRDSVGHQPLKSPVPGSIELVIFDCDGVLIDSERLAVKVDVAVLHELGWPLTEAEVIERFVGRSDRDTRAEIEAHLGRTLPDGWDEAVEHRYRAGIRERAHSRRRACLEALDRITLPTCIASSGTHDHLRYTLGLTGLYDAVRRDGSSAPRTSRTGSPRPTCSSTPPSGWRRRRTAAWSSRTAAPACRRRARRACACSRTPAG